MMRISVFFLKKNQIFARILAPLFLPELSCCQNLGLSKPNEWLEQYHMKPRESRKLTLYKNIYHFYTADEPSFRKPQQTKTSQLCGKMFPKPEKKLSC